MSLLALWSAGVTRSFIVSSATTSAGGPQRTVWRRGVILAVLSAGLFLAGMDLTVLHVAVPSIRADLSPSNAEMLWLVDVYSLTVAALLITSGIVGDRIGRKRVALAGFAVFGLASAACGFSGSVATLMVSRTVLGVGTAMIMASTVAILRGVWTDDHERAVATGVWTAAHGIGATLGPAISGAILEHFPWGGIFLVNVPVVLVALIVGARVLPDSRDPDPADLDGRSLGLSVLGLAGVVYSIKQISESVEATLTALPIGLGAAGLVIWFVVRQLRLPRPLLDVRLFASRRFSIAVAAVLVCFGSYVALLFFLAQWFQYVAHYSTLVSGVALVPLAAANAVGAVTGPALADRFGQRPVLAVGLAAFAVAAAALALGGLEGGYAVIAVLLLPAGFGAGMIMTLGADSVMAAARPEKAGQAAAVQETTFELSAGLGIALLGTILAVVYGRSFVPIPGLPAAEASRVAESVTDADEVARALPPALGGLVDTAAASAFDSGGATALAVMAGSLAAVAALVLVVLPGRSSGSAVS